MNDLISRQAAIDALKTEYMAVGILGEQWAISQCIDAIKKLPSVQSDVKDITVLYKNIQFTPEELGLINDSVLCHLMPERKIGRWEKRYISEYRFQYHCSECGMIQVCGEPNYCPNCGALMKGGVNDG